MILSISQSKLVTLSLSLSLSLPRNCGLLETAFIILGLLRVTGLRVNPSDSFYILESVVHEPTLTTVITVFLGAIHRQLLFREVWEGSLLEESLALREPGGGKGPARPALLLVLDGSYGSFRRPVHRRREGSSERESEERSSTWHARGCECRHFSPTARSRCTLLRIPRTPCRRVHSFQESSPTCRRGHCVLGPSSCSPSRRCGGGALPCPWSTASRAFSSTAPTLQCRRKQFLKIPSIVPKGKPSCFLKKGTTRLNNSALKRHVSMGVTGAWSRERG